MNKIWEIENRVTQRCRKTENWWGSSYDLSMAYEKSTGTQERLLLLHALWEHPYLQGIVDNPEKFGSTWQRPDEKSAVAGNRCYGCIKVNDSSVTGCLSIFIEDEDTLWLCLAIPLVMLEPIFNVTYPLLPENNQWTKRIDRTLTAIGETVYQQRSFKVAAIGEEAAMMTFERAKGEIRTSSKGFLIGEPLYRSLHIIPYGTRLSEKLWWTGSR